MPTSSAVAYRDHQRSFDHDIRRRTDAVVDSFRQVQIEDAREGSTLGQGRRQTPGSLWKSGYVERAQYPRPFDRGVIDGRQWVSEDTSKFVPGPPESHPFPLQGSYGQAAWGTDGAHGIMLPRQHHDYYLSDRTYSTAEIGSAHPRKGLYRHDPVSQRRPLGEENIRPVVHPDMFDGGIGWHDYLAHFELCADLNSWSEEQMAIYLAVSLRGVAQELLCNLTSEDRRSYTALVRNLAARFGSEGQTELFRTQLKSRMRLPMETLPKLAQGIKRLVARAYPQAVTPLREMLAMDHFIDALHNSESRLRLKQNKPRNLDEAVCMAIELEAFQKAEAEQTGTTGTKYIRMTATDEVSRLQKKIAVLERQLNRLQEDRRAHMMWPSKAVNQNLRRDRKNDLDQHVKGQSRMKKEVRCWKCNQTGHFQARCKYKSENQKKEESENSNAPN